MGRSKPKIFENILIEGIADDGKCIAHHDGAAIFVRDVAPGDIVDVRAKKSRKNFFEAVPVQFKELSKNRTNASCRHFGTCGGCKWQHISYGFQAEQKQKIVEDNLQRIGKVQLPEINPIIKSENTFHYRNKLEFTFSNKRWLTREEIDSGNEFDNNALGFHVPKLFDRIVDIEECLLQPEPSNEIRNEVRTYGLRHNLSFYDIRTKQGLLRNLIIRNSIKGELMVIVQFGEASEEIFSLLDHLKESFPEISSLLYVINTKGNETFHDLEVITYDGQGFIQEEMPTYKDPEEKLKFRIGPKSFYQTNSHQAQVLYKTAVEMAGFTGDETVYDLYTGTGTIALYLASLVGKVVGIEYVESAIEDAKINARENEITNVEFLAGDMKDVLNEDLITRHGKPDVVITDPPRAGMHKDVVEKLLEFAPTRIVYVSCNPATQARDLALLDEKYEVKIVQPVDMFPHTSHIECVVLLELRK